MEFPYIDHGGEEGAQKAVYYHLQSAPHTLRCSDCDVILKSEEYDSLVTAIKAMELHREENH